MAKEAVQGENGEAMEKVKQVECQTCGWVGPYDSMAAQFSDMDPGCPVCWGTDFLDVEEDER